MAETEGFEPPMPLRACCISSAVHSNALPPLRPAPIHLSEGGGGVNTVPSRLPAPCDQGRGETFSRSSSRSGWSAGSAEGMAL